MIESNVNYNVEGYSDQWSLINTYDHYGLLENNTWGDETCYLVVDLDQKIVTDGDCPTILEVICETFDDIVTALEDEDII